MIMVAAERDAGGQVVGFSVYEHGESYACAAVSLLTINTVNSIDRFTEADVSCSYDKDGGYIGFRLNDNNAEARLLLEAMMLGLCSVREKYPEEIKISENIKRK